jgi:hypothetical protein
MMRKIKSLPARKNLLLIHPHQLSKYNIEEREILRSGLYESQKKQM